MLLWLINTVIKVTMSVFCLRGVAAVLLLLMLLSTLFISAHSSFVLCVFSSSPLQFVLMEWKMECLRYTEMNRATHRVWCQCYMLQGISSSHLTWRYTKIFTPFFSCILYPRKAAFVPMNEQQRWRKKCSPCSFLMRTNIHIFLICRTVTNRTRQKGSHNFLFFILLCRILFQLCSHCWLLYNFDGKWRIFFSLTLSVPLTFVGWISDRYFTYIFIVHIYMYIYKTHSLVSYNTIHVKKAPHIDRVILFNAQTCECI